MLDTNVVSELMRPEPERHVLAWAQAIDLQTTYTTAITMAEIHSGIALLPSGRRKAELTSAANRIFERFRSRVLPFDKDAATVYSDILAARKRGGGDILLADVLIAAIARNNKAAIATRNVRDFIGSGVDIFDPWTFGTSAP